MDNAYTIYHNPRCGTSRAVLQTLRDHGIEPQVIEYLRTPPDRATLQRWVHDLGVPARELLRGKEALAAELNLLDPSRSDDDLLDAMAAHPILINRPIVVSPKGVRLCRPTEALLALLP